MATPLSNVYDAFLAKLEEDEWMLAEDVNVVEEDWRMLLDAAIFRVRYPHVSLDYDNETGSFVDTLGNDEIQLLALLMKSEWINRCIATWDNLRQLYNDKDFSPANFLEKLNNTGARVDDTCRKMLDKYGRSKGYRPNKIFGKLAGKG